MLIVPAKPLKAVRLLGLPWWTIVAVAACLFWQYVCRRTEEIRHGGTVILPRSIWLEFPSQNNGSLIFVHHMRKTAQDLVRQYKLLASIPKTFTEAWESLRTMERACFTCQEMLFAFPCGCEERKAQTCQPASDAVIPCETCGQYHEHDGKPVYHHCAEHRRIFEVFPDLENKVSSLYFPEISGSAAYCLLAEEAQKGTLTREKQEVLCRQMAAERLWAFFVAIDIDNVGSQHLDQDLRSMLARRVVNPGHVRRLWRARHKLAGFDRATTLYLGTVTATTYLLAWLTYALLVIGAILLWQWHQPDWKTVAEIAGIVMIVVGARWIKNRLD